MYLVSMWLCTFSRNQGSSEATAPAPAADNNSLLPDSSSVSVVMLKESLMEDEVLYNYISVAGLINVCEKYIVTDVFEQLTSKIESENMIILRGPKGCGKSLSLITLLNHIRLQKNVLYITANTLKLYKNVIVKRYFKNILKTELPQSLCDFANFFLYDFVSNFCKKNTLYLLIDFCSLGSVEADIFDLMVKFSRMEGGNLHKVVALSSGEGHDVQEKSYREEISKLHGIGNPVVLYVDGFSETEAKEYIKQHNPHLRLDGVSSHCGTNPLLLSTWIMAEKGKAIANTKEIVKRFVENNLHFGDSTQLVLDLDRFRACKKYCGLALWEIQLTSKEVHDYHTTWLSQHNVLILKDNVLRMNFPMLIPLLLTVLNKMFPSITDFDKVRKKEQSVNGFMFEAEFFATKQLDFAYKKYNVGNNIELSLDVVHVEDCFSKITLMHQGILYALRSGHPVIDGVGFFVQRDVKWLVFIQVSLSDYNKHDKKLSSLFQRPKTKHAKAMSQEIQKTSLSYFTYYKRLVNDDKLNVLLVYVSPQNSAEAMKQLEKDVWSNVPSQHKQNSYVGIISQKSDFYKQQMLYQHKHADA